MQKAAVVLTTVFLIFMTPGDSAAQETDYLINTGAVLDFEALRPLVAQCQDLGVLEVVRDRLQTVGDLETLRQPLEDMGYLSFSGCPSGIEAMGITEVDPGQRSALRQALERYRQSASPEPIGDHEFSLRDIERKCEAWKYSDNYGELECRGYEFRPLERKCEVYFYSDELGEVECRGSEFRVVERKCEAVMYSENYADLDC